MNHRFRHPYFPNLSRTCRFRKLWFLPHASSTTGTLSSTRMQQTDITPAIQKLTQAGIQCQRAPRTFEETHEKAFVIDGATAIVMSFNLTAEYFGTTRDFGIVTTVPAGGGGDRRCVPGRLVWHCDHAEGGLAGVESDQLEHQANVADRAAPKKPSTSIARKRRTPARWRRWWRRPSEA